VAGTRAHPEASSPYAHGRGPRQVPRQRASPTWAGR
jgi:hypothetical protein